MQGLGLLPALREDLKLFPATANRDGSPAWMIQDPVTNRFFRIGWLEFELLSRWSLRAPQVVLQTVASETPLQPTAEDLNELVQFFRQHQLVRASDAGSVDFLNRLAHKAKGSRASWLLHNYLFFRVPLVRPQRFLQAVAPVLGWLYSMPFFYVALAAALVGLMLAARQWDQFVHTFQDFFSPAGLLGYALALMVAKTLHELGHAVTATRYGVRVAHMGVAFLVLWPMLYTDTSESWRLDDRRKRFRIAAAGMAAEFALAGFATLGWSLASEGPVKSALFFLATTSWVLTLGINASPFMRFDGYFLLSDTLDLPNLHQRAGDLARAQMRRSLFGWKEPDPEVFEPALRRFLVAFAYITWLYRFVIFIGIAVAVYLFFFKLLGIFLFIVEILWFIARPVWMEMKHWGPRWKETRWTHALGLGAVALTGLIVLLWPWQRDVTGEAWLHAQQQQIIYSPFPARVVAIHREGRADAGAALVTLDSPDTRSKALVSGLAAQTLALQLDQTVGRADGAERRALLAEQLQQQLAETAAQSAELKRLELQAAFDGQFVDLEPEIRPGVWITANQPIGMLVDSSRWVIDALVDQKSLARIRVGDVGRFHVRNQPGRRFDVKVRAIDSTRAQSVPHPMMAMDHGGRLAVAKQTNGSLVPRDSMYRVRLEPLDATSESVPMQSMALGSVRIEGERRSLVEDLWTAVAAVAVRESGF
jgi:putative peptide zinc metalloprotease protein